MTLPRLPNPRQTGSWQQWGEALIRLLQSVLDRIQAKLIELEECCGGGGVPTSGSFTLDDGTASADGSFTFDEGGA